jgi:hypothetical protein
VAFLISNYFKKERKGKNGGDRDDDDEDAVYTALGGRTPVI